MKRLVFGGLFIAYITGLWLAAAAEARAARFCARRRAMSQPSDFNPWEDL